MFYLEWEQTGIFLYKGNEKCNAIDRKSLWRSPGSIPGMVEVLSLTGDETEIISNLSNNSLRNLWPFLSERYCNEIFPTASIFSLLLRKLSDIYFFK